jgi:hypothetical protein
MRSYAAHASILLLLPRPLAPPFNTTSLPKNFTDTPSKPAKWVELHRGQAHDSKDHSYEILAPACTGFRFQILDSPKSGPDMGISAQIKLQV